MTGTAPPRGEPSAPRLRDRVLLLHGLWMRGFAMWPLAARLRARGFAVEVIDYASLRRGPQQALDEVASRLAAARTEAPLHLVGHSLGGVIAVQAAAAAGATFRGRIVCLGSPLAGSAVARALATRRGAVARLAGRSAALLSQGVGAVPAGVEVGVIAGHRPFGVGRLLHTLDAPHDGTVPLRETRVDGLAAHVTVPSTHTGLVYDGNVAALAARFLRTGRFEDTAAPDAATRG